MSTRKIVLTVIFEIIAIFSFSYFIVMVRYAGIGTSFAFVWLGMALFFAVCGAAVFILGKRNVSFPPAVKVVISVLAAAIIILFAVVEGMIISGMKEKTNEQYDYVIVLGARVRGTTVTKSLRKRLDKAFEYIEKNDNTILVLSGGQGNGEDVSEAQAMYDYLVQKGVDKSRLLLEDKSTSIVENIEYSMKIIEKNSQNATVEVGFITNNFHVFRAELVCRNMGYDIKGIPAKSDNKLLVNYMFREFFALVKYKITGNI